MFDRQSRTIVDTAETLTASWYVTGGALDQPAATITDSAVLSTATGWTAPAGTAMVELALILRDSRGGSDIARATIAVGESIGNSRPAERYPIGRSSGG